MNGVTGLRQRVVRAVAVWLTPSRARTVLATGVTLCLLALVVVAELPLAGVLLVALALVLAFVLGMVWMAALVVEREQQARERAAEPSGDDGDAPCVCPDLVGHECGAAGSAGSAGSESDSPAPRVVTVDMAAPRDLWPREAAARAVFTGRACFDRDGVLHDVDGPVVAGPP